MRAIHFRPVNPVETIGRITFAAIAFALSTWTSAADNEHPKSPDVFDLCKYQTSIKNQTGGTCTYYPPVAALEAFYARHGEKVDLSVEHLRWLRNVTTCKERDGCDDAENLCSTLDGGGGVYNLGLLRDYAICPIRDLPDSHHIGDWSGDYYKGFGLTGYRWDFPFSQFKLNRWNFDPRQIPPSARLNARYGIEKFVTLSEQDRKDPRKFEQILAAGHEIIFALCLHENQDDYAHGDPLWRIRPNAKPGDPNEGHEMLIVGYDRKRRFFIVKNQWGRTNYTAMKDKLPPEWKDVVKYDGYTLIDYGYLAACGEAAYIQSVTPVGATRFTAQRALGQWQVTFLRRNIPIMTAVLAWRRLPDSNGPHPNLRIGDLITREGTQYHVNARLDGDGSKPYKVSLYINVDMGTLPFDSTSGATWTGELTFPEKGGGTLHLQGAKNGQTVWGGPLPEVQIAATLVENENLLRAISVPGNLLVNGSFEECPKVDRVLSLDQGSTAIQGWKVIRGQIDVVGRHWRHATGNHSLDLHGSPGFGGIEQTFQTVVGHRYRVTFCLAANPDGAIHTKKIGVAAAGLKTEFTFDATGKSLNEMGWVVKEWEFKAGAPETTLQFYTLETQDESAGPALDDVHVTPVVGTNLLVNGSFEEGADLKNNDWLETKSGSSDIHGWKVDQSVLIISRLWQHADGKRSLLLHGPGQRGAIEQSFRTRKGQHYRVSFSLSVNPNKGRWQPELSSASLEVSAAGRKQQFSFADKTESDMGWITKEWDFQATDEHTTLSFSVLEAKGFWHGPTLDNVRVMVVTR